MHVRQVSRKKKQKAKGKKVDIKFMFVLTLLLIARKIRDGSVKLTMLN